MSQSAEADPPAAAYARAASAASSAAVRRTFALWNEERVDDFARRFAYDAEVDLSAVIAGVAPIRGRDRLSHFWAALRSNWSGRDLEIADILDLGDGRFIADCRLVARHATSADGASERLICLFRVDDDLQIARVQLAPDIATAARLGDGARD